MVLFLMSVQDILVLYIICIHITYYILYITYNIIQHVWPLWWITQRLEKIRRVYFSVLCTIYFSEMEFIIFHLQCSTLLFSCYTVANLIGLLHLLLHDDSNSCKHNVTLLYSTHIWTHLLPSLVLSLEFHGSSFFFFFFAVVLS